MAKAPASTRPAQFAFKRSAIAYAAAYIALGAIAMGTLTVAPAAYAQEATKAFDIPAGSLESVLNGFAKASGIQLSFKPEQVAGRTSSGLKGNYSVSAGLKSVLNGSGLAAVQQANGSYALAQAAAADAATAALPAVTVTSAVESGLQPVYAGGQVARGGSLGVLGSADVMDTPFSTMNYTAELIANQQARSLADVVENEASVRSTYASGGFGDSFTIRGYAVSADDVGLNGLYGLASTTVVPSALMERVEVIKGPGTLLSGMGIQGSVGGGINIVTKRAGDEPLTRVTTTYETKGQFGTAIDVSRRFGENKEWGIRVNGQYKDGETNIADSNVKNTLAAVALDYTTNKLRWTLDAFKQTGDTENSRAQYSIASTATSIPSAPSGHTTAYLNNNVTSKDSVAATRLEYDINETLTAYGAFGYHEGSNNQTFPSGTMQSDGSISYYNPFYDAYTKTTSADVGMRIRFNSWGIGHTMSVGASQLNREQGYAYGGSASTSSTASIYSPSALPDFAAARFAPSKTSDTKLSSLSLADTLSIADGRLLISAGVRKQEIKAVTYDSGVTASTSDTTAYSPLLGIVVKPMSNLSVYGNFSTGLSAGEIVGTDYANHGQALPPIKSKQYETGVKLDWGRITTSAAVFQFSKANGVADPVTNIYSYNGEQRNRGVELAAYGEAVRGVRVMASATFLNATQTHTQNGTNDGKEAIGVPRRSFNLSGDWDTPWLSGLSLNARAVYTSSMYNNAANTLTVPSWIRYDIGARYSTNVAGKPVVFRATVQNLFNKNYWLTTPGYGYLSAAAARTLMLSAQVDF
jgi:iron complex outermembrane receptor protein